MQLADFERVIEAKKRGIVTLEAQLRALKEDVQADVAAYERVMRAIEASRNFELANAPITRPDRQKGGLVAKAVCDAVIHVGMAQRVFSIRDIMDYLAKTPDATLGFNVESNRPNISNQLSELAELKVIELVEASSGRKPATYRLVDEAEPTQSSGREEFVDLGESDPAL